MTFDTAVNGALSLMLLVFGGGAGVRYLLERRKAKAEGHVAQSTAELQIDAAQLANISTQMKLMQAAWNAERASMQGRIDMLAQELAEEREESAAKQREIESLREWVARLQDELAEVGERLAHLSSAGEQG
jgi:chromosome segregation ATPase